MYSVKYSSRFKKDLKLMEKRGYKMRKIFDIMTALENGWHIPKMNMEHQLSGEYRGCLECHIQPDWLLIYHFDFANNELYFVRTGSHSDIL